MPKKIVRDKKTFRMVLRDGLWLLLLLALVPVGCGQKDGSGSKEPAVASEGSASETMQVIEERVSELRGLEPRGPVAKAYLTTEELRQRIEEEAAEDYSEQEAHDDTLLYVAFELMEPSVDLYDLLIELQIEQVVGFYDPDTEEMYVVKSGREPGALERWTFSHEYTHVLQDQHFDLQAMGFTDEGDDEEEDSERQLAITSLVEGDALLLQQQYAMQYFDLKALQEVLDQVQGIDSSVIDSAPPVVRESLLFPYESGLSFVMTLFEEDGWSGVDAAYANPPVSTEQILHPERYPDDVPRVVSVPPLTDTLGAGWRLVDEDVLGEFGLRLYLDVHIDPSDGEGIIETAAEGWGGDRYAVYWREDETLYVVALLLTWDTPADADEFLDAYVRFAENRFGGGPSRREDGARLWSSGEDALLLARNDQDEILILIAPDESTVERIRALFPGF